MMKNCSSSIKNTTFCDVFDHEIEAIRQRRKRLGQPLTGTGPASLKSFRLEPNLISEPPFDMFGIALSGGGIRSATINLGFLHVLNRLGILELADYLSTVSGGGYTGSYVTKKLRSLHNKAENPYRELFNKKDIQHLKEHGSYLAPSKSSWGKAVDYATMIGGFAMVALLHLLWYVLALSTLIYGLQAMYLSLPARGFHTLYYMVLLPLIFCTGYYYFFHGLRFCSLWPVKRLIQATGLLLSLAAALAILSASSRLSPLGCLFHLSCTSGTRWHDFIVLAALTFLFGLFANPNILSSHQFYRFRLADAFMWMEKNRRKLWEISPGPGPRDWGAAPYPLINTTLNLSGKDIYSGIKTCDYFLLSPYYCGSKLTGFIPTSESEYKGMTLATAVTISGAALNPEMGYRSSKALAFFMTLLNLRLGYWALNPHLYKRQLKWYEQIPACMAECCHYWPTYWPIYNIMELLDRSRLSRWRVNLSDGGHIENLGVFELLRRKCKLIIAVDAGADPEYRFSDLKNLVIRARNELGVAIEFRQEPEEEIRPLSSTGFSKRQFCIADIYDLPDSPAGRKQHTGLLVYVKASIKAQKFKQSHDLVSKSYTYKVYHPRFPHEPTSDQFFDTVQWEAYYNLGKNMAFSLFKECRRACRGMKHGTNSIKELYELIDLI